MNALTNTPPLCTQHTTKRPETHCPCCQLNVLLSLQGEGHTRTTPWCLPDGSKCVMEMGAEWVIRSYGSKYKVCMVGMGVVVVVGVNLSICASDFGSSNVTIIAALIFVTTATDLSPPPQPGLIAEEQYSRG